MGIGVEIDRVLWSRESRQHAEIGLIAGGEHDAVLAVEKIRKLALELAMDGIGAVGDARARRAGAIELESLLAGGNAIGIESDAHIIVGAGENGFLAGDDG